MFYTGRQMSVFTTVPHLNLMRILAVIQYPTKVPDLLCSPNISFKYNLKKLKPVYCYYSPSKWTCAKSNRHSLRVPGFVCYIRLGCGDHLLQDYWQRISQAHKQQQQQQSWKKSNSKHIKTMFFSDLKSYCRLLSKSQDIPIPITDIPSYIVKGFTFR